jgi:hypothetical protein
MDSQLPPAALQAVEESRNILEHFRDASQRRIEFLNLMTQHLKDVVIPAVEDLAAEFSDTLLEIEIDGPGFPPRLNVTAKLVLLPSEPPQSVGFRYEPSRQSNQVEFSTQEPNGDWISLNERPVNDLSRETVIAELAALVNRTLKRWSAPLEEV